MIKVKLFGCLFLPPANEVWGKVTFSVACVKNSIHGGGLPQCMLGYHTPLGPGTPLPQGPGTPPDRQGTPPDQAPPSRHPPDQAPPRADPPDQVPPPAQCMLGDTVNECAVCILLECNLVSYVVEKPGGCIDNLTYCNVKFHSFFKSYLDILNQFNFFI